MKLVVWSSFKRNITLPGTCEYVHRAKIPTSAETSKRGSELVITVGLMIRPSWELAPKVLVKLVLTWTSFLRLLIMSFQQQFCDTNGVSSNSVQFRSDNTAWS